MQVIITVNDLRKLIKVYKLKNKSIALVPTMGFLHEGHMSLVDEARKENDIVVTSIFVNPTQFSEGEDLDTYPADLQGDQKKLLEHNVDVLFYPSIKEMYPEGYSTFIEVEGNITNVLCGASRKGHFKGVTTVVSKLFNIVTPDRAYFGQKDAQQIAVIMKMVRDLNMNIEIIPCEIFREEDGLAMSSRNIYLSINERNDALVLSQSLYEAKKMIENGEKDSNKIIDFIIDKINSVHYAVIDYVEIVDAFTLDKIDNLKGTILIALAVKIGRPRLIDNLRLEVK